MTNAQIILSKTKTLQIKPIFRGLLATAFSTFAALHQRGGNSPTENNWDCTVTILMQESSEYQNF